MDEEWFRAWPLKGGDAWITTAQEREGFTRSRDGAYECQVAARDVAKLIEVRTFALLDGVPVRVWELEPRSG